VLSRPDDHFDDVYGRVGLKGGNWLRSREIFRIKIATSLKAVLSQAIRACSATLRVRRGRKDLKGDNTRCTSLPQGGEKRQKILGEKRERAVSVLKARKAKKK